MGCDHGWWFALIVQNEDPSEVLIGPWRDPAGEEITAFLEAYRVQHKVSRITVIEAATGYLVD
jgi:hypothetical protein